MQIQKGANQQKEKWNIRKNMKETWMEGDCAIQVWNNWAKFASFRKHCENSYIIVLPFGSVMHVTLKHLWRKSWAQSAFSETRYHITDCFSYFFVVFFFHRTKVFSGWPRTRTHFARPTDTCSTWQSSTTTSTTPFACWRTRSNASTRPHSGYPCHGCTNPTLPLVRVHGLNVPRYASKT